MFHLVLDCTLPFSVAFVTDNLPDVTAGATGNTAISRGITYTGINFMTPMYG